MMQKQNNELDPNMSVSDLIDKFPQVIPVFLRYRMACVGCSMSSFETLDSAAKIYGVAPETFISELRQAILEPETDQ
ncbi:MAG: DUF1858 domain-containing protein [Chloroflexi bacterium]|nr:DUF1858 domain-containing protein [Chloroflexota bacterium]